MSAFKHVTGRGDFAAELSDAGDKLALVYFTKNANVQQDGAEMVPLEEVATEYGSELVYLLVIMQSADDTDEYTFPTIFYDELPCAVIYREGTKMGQVIELTVDNVKRKVDLIKSEDDTSGQGDQAPPTADSADQEDAGDQAGDEEEAGSKEEEDGGEEEPEAKGGDDEETHDDKDGDEAAGQEGEEAKEEGDGQGDPDQVDEADGGEAAEPVETDANEPEVKDAEAEVVAEKAEE
ncbi:hypothetical protein HDE_04886 [Halotydeus destructor]|nr:hypothetical protein HDE_04886 [Halotydeus destructor]